MYTKGEKTGASLAGGRVEIYDWVRLLATVLVIIGHCAYLSIGAEHGGVEYVVPDEVVHYFYTGIFEQIRVLSNWVYDYHMPLFFFLSGAVLALRPVTDPVRFVEGKSRRLILPYFVCGWLFMLPVKYLSGFYTREGFLQAVPLLLTGSDSGHLWFLPALFWCMVLFVLLEKLLQGWKLESKYLLLGLCGVLAAGSTLLPSDALFLIKGMSNLFWFALGYVFEWKRREASAWGKGRLLALFGLLLILAWVQKRFSVIPSVFVTLLGICRIYLLSKLCLTWFPGFLHTTVGKVLNRNLFSIYLYHDPLEYVVLKVFFDGNYLTSGKACVLYYFCRLILVPVASVCIGEAVSMVIRLWKKRSFVK